MEYNTNSYKELLHDYIKRSMKNYYTIYADESQHACCLDEKKECVFEVTQLINSLFGILIMSFEVLKKKNREEQINDWLKEVNRNMKKVDIDAFDCLSTIVQELKKEHHFYDSYDFDSEKEAREISLIYHLRNSLAHSGNEGIHFTSGISGNNIHRIESVIFYDKDRLGHEFCVELSVKQIEKIVKCLNCIFGNYSDFSTLTDYQSVINEKRKMMELYGQR